MNIKATATPNRERGCLVFELELVGNTELDHELLAAFFDENQRVIVVPTHVGDKLSARFTMYDPSAYPTALHNMENRKRANDGRPSIEEEEQAAKEKRAAEGPRPNPPTLK